MEASEAAGVTGIEKRMVDYMGAYINFDRLLWTTQFMIVDEECVCFPSSKHPHQHFGASIVPFAHWGYY